MIPLTLYLVGYNINDARGNFPFDCIETAQDYKLDNPGMKIYSVQASLDFSTMEALEI